MKTKNIFWAALTVMCALTVQTACTSKNNPSGTQEELSDTTAITINLDSIVIKPYLQFGTSLDDVKEYMASNFADYSDKTPDSLIYYDFEGGPSWAKNYANGKCQIGFYFSSSEGKNLKLVAYDFFFPMPLEPIMAELERNGFTNQGEIKFDDFNADISYLYLSSDERIEAMPSSWEKDGGSWAISFQPFDKEDLNHLVNK